MSISTILDKAKQGELESCRGCPWSPKRTHSVGFGVSCVEHGLNWKLDEKANSMNIMQDPGGTTPMVTGRLCAVHNSKNSSDKTARNYVSLWESAVSLKSGDLEHGGYLKKHYAANALMHGATVESGLRDKSVVQTVRSHCSRVLEEQILSVRPNVIIAMGVDSVNSLYDIGLISRNWPQIRRAFGQGAYCEAVNGWRNTEPFKVFCTYHTSAGIVNRTISRLYDRDKTERLIKEKLDKLPSPESVRNFLYQHSNIECNASHRGMRFLLSHWLDIGVEIRAKYSL